MYQTRGDKTKRILNLLRHKARTAREIIDALALNNQDTYKVTKRLLGRMDVPKFDYTTWKREEEKRFYMLLAKFRKEGLIEKDGFNMKNTWKLTARGIEKIAQYAKLKTKYPILPNKKYTAEKIKDKIIIIFDIPEKYRRQRAWLRHHLNILDFTMLQQSAWIGNSAVPSDFIHDLREANLLKYIHIFKISKSGSLTD